MPKSPQIILASLSPARKKLMASLMKELGLKFKTVGSDYEEDMTLYKNPKKLIVHLASEKAKLVTDKFPDSIIVGADTFATIDKDILGKPKTLKEAKEMVKRMSENTVDVHTGLSVIKTDSKSRVKKELTSYTHTKLTFVKLTDKNIKDIVRKDDVLNVAGALTIEGESGKYVDEIDGDYHNVIGLPLFQLKEMLAAI